MAEALQPRVNTLGPSTSGKGKPPVGADLARVLAGLGGAARAGAAAPQLHAGTPLCRALLARALALVPTLDDARFCRVLAALVDLGWKPGASCVLACSTKCLSAKFVAACN